MENRNEQMEHELQCRISESVTWRHGGPVPADVEDRIAAEEQHITGNGYGTLFAAAAKLVAFAAGRGYSVGFRGLIGNLYIAYLLGIAHIDPLELGLRWEGCLGPDGSRMPGITLNVAPELLGDMTAYLGEILPGYDPNSEHPAIRLCPHQLMGLVGEARRQAGTQPRYKDIFSADLIARAYQEDVSGIPVLGDLDRLQDFARQLKPKTFADMTKLIGLCLAPAIQFQAERFSGQPNSFDGLIGTREDIYDFCVQHGIGADDAFRIMERVGKGGSHRLTGEYRDMLTAKGFPSTFVDTLDAIDYLYPRGQCADYLYWALTLLWYRK